ncbi:hypothetical protein MUK42_28538 [Musa troglodytarum]|uniref:Uncharacterized protein n=1 Tax=Musa troglodytarum TaxID=320322 RepID=A0A9E7K0G8_9LILI|nr:hypothetical protein MUK42_28538 [Musa troglodytarum]
MSTTHSSISILIKQDRQVLANNIVPYQPNKSLQFV